MAQFSALTMAALSVGALAAVGGSVSYAAKDAQPGDLLYPVHTSLYGDVSADADAELSAAQDIFDQAVSLQAEGKLDADVHADLTDDLNLHVQAVHGLITDLEAEGNTEDAQEVRAMLRAKLRDFDSLFRLQVESDSSASSTASQTSSMDQSSSSEDDDDDSSEGSVNVDVHSDDSVHMDSSDGSVHIDADADADATVNID